MLLALTALALALRLTSLSRSLFTDEAYSLAVAQRGFGHMVVLFGYEANGTPYSIALWPLIRIFGDSEALLRLPALIAGTASVPALWWATRQFAAGRYAKTWVPLLAAGLLALNPMAVFYSQEARAYAFVVLAACLAFGALARAVEQPEGPRAWIGYVLAMAALGYCDLLAVPIALPAQALIAWRGGREGIRRWLYSLLAVFVVCLPLLVAAAIAHSRRNALYWLPKPNRALIELTLQEFTGGFSGVSAVRFVSIAAGAALVGAALWRLRRVAPDPGTSREERGMLAMAAAWGLVPGALLMAVSLVSPVFWPRYAILVLPGLCLLAALAAGLVWDRRHGIGGPVIAAGCLAVLAGAGLYADVRQRDAFQENWPPSVAWLQSARHVGEPTILDNALALAPLGYYDPAFRAHDGALVVQEWHDRALPAGLVGFKDPGGYGDVPDGPPSVAAFKRVANSNGGAVWMVFAGVDKDLQGEPLRGPAVVWAHGHCNVQVRESVGVRVLHATGCPATGSSGGSPAGSGTQ